MKNKHKTSFLHLVPVFISLLFGIFCATLLVNSQTESYMITPFSESSFGVFGNAAYFVALVGFGAVLLYMLLKRKNLRLINILTTTALTLAVLLLSIVYTSAMLSTVSFAYSEALIVAISIAVTAIADYVILKAQSRLGNWIVMCLGGAFGTFLGVSIPILSALLILGFLAIYDIFAVYRGPVGKIAKNGLERFRGLSVSFKDIQMGLGDLTFYSMLSGAMLFNFGYASCLASMLGILIGCAISFRMLEKKGMFPGLPFPVSIGIAAGLVASLPWI